ncbi:hypothetical protein L596_006280 [Steinernema carpocapsae]|uniref:Uncharacterized protein n=1 Tax=Steinernema carpocapsae TaxID=34508 RepID=A0A4U8V7S6_STECR|nr:hypothetical protein L596_006280 [Steinernema carpocapsae]
MFCQLCHDPIYDMPVEDYFNRLFCRDCRELRESAKQMAAEMALKSLEGETFKEITWDVKVYHEFRMESEKSFNDKAFALVEATLTPCQPTPETHSYTMSLMNSFVAPVTICRYAEYETEFVVRRRENYNEPDGGDDVASESDETDSDMSSDEEQIDSSDSGVSRGSLEDAFRELQLAIESDGSSESSELSDYKSDEDKSVDQ